MDENPQDVATDENVEVEEATESNEDSQDETVDLAEELERQRKANLDILARTKRAEAELRELKKAQTQSNINSTPQLSDELKLIARGLSDEEIDKAKVIAKGLGVSLPEAIKDPLFTIFQSDLKEKERREKARLGASKGSGESADSALIKQGMSREEHEEAFKKVMGQVRI